jgi:hypothetical protein
MGLGFSRFPESTKRLHELITAIIYVLVLFLLTILVLYLSFIFYFVKVKVNVKLSFTGLDSPLGVNEIEAPRISRKSEY